MLPRLREHLSRTGLLPAGTPVLVGYSGGADSTCLLHALRALDVEVVAATLDHGQRPEGAEEARRCGEFAAEIGAGFVPGRADVPRLARERGIGLEEAGREARYEFFRQAAFRMGCPLVATAHTRTDRVETMLFHLARGTGLAGLGGIPARRGNVVRPLLPFSREETVAYCREHGLWTIEDPANFDPAFARARVRHRVFPEMALVHPGFEANAARLADLAAEEDAFLDGTAAAALERAEIPLNGALRFLAQDAEVAFERDRLTSLPVVLFRRAVRLAVGALGAGLDARQTAAVLDGQNLPRGAVTAEGGEVVVEWDEERVVVRLLRPDIPFRHPLTRPGETESDEFGWRFVAYDEPAPSLPPVRTGLATWIRSAALKGGLYFRPAQPGDTFLPLGGEHRRRVPDLLSESGLTPAARARLPLVCDLLGPVWIPGVAPEERVRPVPGEAAVRLEFGPLGEASDGPGRPAS